MANQYVNKLVKDGVTKFDLTGDTVTPETLAEGVTAHDASGKRIVGKLIITPVILGLQVNFTYGSFTRLEDAQNLNAGVDFNNFSMYKRRRCNLADDGTVNAYYGDANYTEDGSNGQVMVEQPKFYYKIEVISTNEVKYYISNVQSDGFVLHPAFVGIDGMTENDYFYESAFEASKDTDGKLISKAGVLPTSNTILNLRKSANSRGKGWEQANVWTECADQLLMLIEYGKFNMQSELGNGIVDSSTELTTGRTTGNGSSGDTSGYNSAVCWRGKENMWGNKPSFVDGINIKNRYAWIIKDSHSYQSDKFDTPYVQHGHRMSSTMGYIQNFGYDYYNSDGFNWAFIPYETGGSSAYPVGDYLTVANNSTIAYVAVLGGGNRSGLSAGPFCWNFYVSSTSSYGARLVYIPQ